MSADSGSAFTLFIETGLHAGTVQRLSPGIYTLGSELEADIILADKEIEAVHLIVELDRRGLRLEPLQGAIAVHGESVSLEPGGERHLTFPASFTIGATKIKITAPKDVVQTKRRQRVALTAAGLALMAVLGFQIVRPPLTMATDGQASALTQPAEPLTSALMGNVPMPDDIDGLQAQAATTSDVDDVAAAAPDVTIDAAAAALRARLAADDFSDIEVKTAVDRIMVRGDAEPERMGEWQDVRIWFDSAFGQDFLLVANVEPAEQQTPPKLAIEAVWSGDDPYLIAGGRRFFVGAPIGDGWTIDRIGPEEIAFKRGDKSFSLSL